MNSVDCSHSKLPRRNKLGLALAGGGFRASLFHLGVLHRMAELDLLRSVEVLSTVSGGSIIGALYILLLKKRLDKKTTLTRDEYVNLIEELDRILVKGIKKNLRTRLFMNPLGLLRVLVTNDTLGRRMARIYERYLYQGIVEEIRPTPWWSRIWRPGRIRLRETVISPGGNPIEGGIESYNCKAVQQRGSAVTNLILNSTSLNSGVPFRFTSVEIGDSRLGFFRHSEIKDLLERKKLLFTMKLSELRAALNNPGASSVKIRSAEYDSRTVSLAYWWRMKKNQPGAHLASPARWEALFAVDKFPGRMLDAEFGQLRRMKLPAWYLRRGTTFTPPVSGGQTADEHLEQFWRGFEQIYEEQAQTLENAIKNDQTLRDLLLDFVLEFYYLRSAEVMSFQVQQHWNKLRLGEAVGASACFPPVFPPFIMLDFYDDWHVSRLGLTDGGVYDNVGLSALFEERCNYVIASDTGGLFDVNAQSSTGRMGMSGRIVSILMDDVAGSQREVIKERRNAAIRVENIARTTTDQKDLLTNDDLKGLSFFHIKSPTVDGPGLELNLDRRLLASLRTDLDGFGDVEIAALVNHGYDAADRYLRQYFTDSPYADKSKWTPAQKEPKPIFRSDDEVKKILRAGKSRFFRALKLFAPLSIVFSLAVVIAVIWRTRSLRLSFQDAISYLVTQGLNWMDANVPLVGAGWTKYRLSVGSVICVAAVAAALVKILPAEFRDRLKNQYLPLYNRLSTVYKWIRSLALNVFWFVGYLPLVVAVVASSLAWVSHLFYYLPFQQKTKNPVKKEIGKSMVSPADNG